MSRKVVAMLIAAAFICGSAFAMCGMCGTGEKVATGAKSVAAKINNTVCPVSGDKVNMDNPTTVEYKGETYNLCCSMCTAEFNKDPEKYSAIAKKRPK